LIHGTLLDDSLSAQVSLCLLTEKCRDDAGTALAVLLVTRSLTGGVHTRASCAQGVTALVMRRQSASMAMTPPPPGRLSPTPPPKSPRATTIASEVKIGQIPGRRWERPSTRRTTTRATRARPARPKASRRGLLNEGAGYLKDGRFEKAREALPASVQKDPQRARLQRVGVTFYARADYDEALAWYKKALEADPRFGDAFYNIACVYSLQSRPQLAFRYLRLAALNHYFRARDDGEGPGSGRPPCRPAGREISR